MHAIQAVHATIAAALAKGFDDTFLLMIGLGVIGLLVSLSLRSRTKPAVAEDGEAEDALPPEMAVGF